LKLLVGYNVRFLYFIVEFICWVIVGEMAGVAKVYLKVESYWKMFLNVNALINSLKLPRSTTKKLQKSRLIYFQLQDEIKKRQKLFDMGINRKRNS
jgi:hypothetical protein